MKRVTQITPQRRRISYQKTGRDNAVFYDPSRLWLKSRSDLDMIDEYGNDAKIIPVMGTMTPNDYVYETVSGWEATDSSSYLEISFYNTGVGINYLFGSYGNAVTRYFRSYVSSGIVYLDIQQNYGTIFRNRLYIQGAVSVGWHVVRFWNAAGHYYATLDGGATLSVGAGLFMGDGVDDGKWIDQVLARVNLSIGAIIDSGGLSPSADDIPLRYIQWGAKHKWVFSASGNYVFDSIGDNHLTWVGNTHFSYDLDADTSFLDDGFSIWYKEGEELEYVPYSSGVPHDVSAFLTDYEKMTDHDGNLTGYNLAPSLLDFDYYNLTPVAIAVLDRSNVTYQTAVSRASSYYDAGNPYRYHSSELGNAPLYNAFFNVGYKGMYFSKIEVDIYDLNYYAVSISEILLYSLDNIKEGQRIIMVYCGSDVFYALGGDFYDSDDYVITKLSDIKQFGAAPSKTPYENAEAAKMAATYPYNDTITFGDIGESYIIGSTINMRAGKTYIVDSTLTLKDGVLTRLTANYVARDVSVTVVSTEGFYIGDWVGVADDDTPIFYPLGQCAMAVQIVNIDRDTNTIYFDPDEVDIAGNIWNLTVASDARMSHVSNIFLADRKDNVTLRGSGVIDTNYHNQHGLNGCLVTAIFEEHRTNCGVSFWVCDNVEVSDLTLHRALRHNINVSGFGPALADMCTGVYVHDIESYEAYNKACNIRYCDTVLVEDYIGNDCTMEDGLMFYLGDTNVVINRITCRNNRRNGVAWNSLHCDGLIATDIITEGNTYAGIAILARNSVWNNLVMKDVLQISDAYANATNVVINGVTIEDFAVADFWGGIVRLQGEIQNVTVNDLVMNRCTGIGILSTAEFGGVPPQTTLFDGGGIYDHTGAHTSLAVGSDITFNDFDYTP